MNDSRYSRLYLIALLWVFMLLGCEHNVGPIGPESEFRQIAWDDLTGTEKATVIDDWREAPVADASSLFPGREAVSVQFNTTQDPLLGPIVVFIDSQTKEVAGRSPRF